MATSPSDPSPPRSETSEVEVARIRSRDGDGSINFSSKLIPPHLHRSKSIDAWVAYAYLKGVSERDMAQVLEVVLGEGAKKLTPNVVSSLKVEWKAQFDEWKKRDLGKITFSYVYADGIYQEIRGPSLHISLISDTESGVFGQGVSIRVVIGCHAQPLPHLLSGDRS
ncbi:MAG: transposase [Ferrimicrobium sp.]|jgi:hypothetical protein|nr:transposase [Ferrimicrobium sp.]